MGASLQDCLACPSCRCRLARGITDDVRRCEACGATFARQAGIWRLLGPGRREVVAAFVDRYSRVRRAEGRTAPGSGALQALPFRDLSGEREAEWRVRAASFDALVARVLVPLETAHGWPLRVLDLGAGVAWLAYRLTLRGHDVAAVDVVTDDTGLGAHRLYACSFTAVEGELDRLPFADGAADVVVWNASLHYATNVAVALEEGLRVLAPGGSLVVMDSPLYDSAASGRAMVREREEAFAREHGMSPAPVGYATEGFLTRDAIDATAAKLRVAWTFHDPWYGLKWWLRPLVARASGRREPARFALIVGRRRRQ